MLRQLKDKIMDALNIMNSDLTSRKEFEDQLQKCQNWLDVTDVVMSVDIRPNSTTELLEDHLQKFKDLLEEAVPVSTMMEDVSEQAGSFQEQLNEADKLTLEGELDSTKDRLKR